MKSIIGKVILAAAFVTILSGCKKNYIISENQAILFQLDYINYAWGYQHNGFFIDNQGYILTYSNPEDWNFTDKDRCLKESQITENIGRCKRSGERISLEELQKYTNYIKNIALSEVTAPKNIAADAGSTEFVCYQFSESSGMYKGYLIKLEGDFSCENLNFYSKKVVLWMKDIKSSLSEN
jgi:hypothetical protein